MADHYSMAHQNNNKEVKYSERSDNQRPGNRIDDPRARALNKEKVAVLGQQNSGSNDHEQERGTVMDVVG